MYELQYIGGDPVELVSSAESLTVDYASNAPVKRECFASGLLPIFNSTMHCSGMFVPDSKERHSSSVLSHSGPFLHSLLRERVL